MGNCFLIPAAWLGRAGQGVARRGLARHGGARQGKARVLNQAKEFYGINTGAK